MIYIRNAFAIWALIYIRFVANFHGKKKKSRLNFHGSFVLVLNWNISIDMLARILFFYLHTHTCAKMRWRLIFAPISLLRKSWEISLRIVYVRMIKQKFGCLFIHKQNADQFSLSFKQKNYAYSHISTCIWWSFVVFR